MGLLRPRVAWTANRRTVASRPDYQFHDPKTYAITAGRVKAPESDLSIRAKDQVDISTRPFQIPPRRSDIAEAWGPREWGAKGSQPLQDSADPDPLVTRRSKPPCVHCVSNFDGPISRVVGSLTLDRFRADKPVGRQGASSSPDSRINEAD